MGHSHYDPTSQCRPAWNAGKTVGTKRPLTQKQIWAVRFFLDREGRVRDRALFDLAIDSKLRGCDLVKIKIGDLVSGTDVRTRAIVIQQKTGKPVQFELTADVRASLLAWLERRGGTAYDYAFPSRVDHTGHLSTRQYARLVDEWVEAVGLSPCRVWHALTTAHEGIDDLQGHQQPSRDPDSAGPHEDREHGPISRCRH